MQVTRYVGNEHILAISGAVESSIGHPIAHAISQYAHNHLDSLPEATNIQHQVGLGVNAIVDGHRVDIGGTKLLAELGIDIPKNF